MTDTGIVEGLVAGLALPPEFTVSQWADANILLPAETSSMPGRWRTDFAPYQREILDSFGDPDIHMVVWMASAQTGKTSAISIGCGFYIAFAPAPMIMVMPTEDMAKVFSQTKLAPMIASTPALSERVADQTGASAANRILHKSFPGGFLRMVGGGSAVALRSVSVKVVWIDETDGLENDVGGEGDPIELAIKRSQTFFDSKVICTSTPTLKGLSKIDSLYQRSDQRKYFVPCHEPQCGEFQVPVWERVHWTQGKPESAQYTCSQCGSFWTDSQLKMAVRQGQWRATAEFRGVAGFHSNQLISPFSSLSEIVEQYERAKDKPNELKVWTNTVLGEVYDDMVNNSLDTEMLLARREGYPKGQLPERCVTIVIGADVQSDRIEASIIGFGPDNEVFYLDHVKLIGDPSANGVWAQLDELAARKFAHPSGKVLDIEAVAVDSGFMTQQVYAWSNKHIKAGRRYHAIKGMSGEGRPGWVQSKMKFKDGAKLWNIGVDAIKSEIMARLTVKSPPANYIHFYKGEQFEDQFFDQLTAERFRIVTDAKGYPKREWVRIDGRRAEVLDCFVYGMAVHSSLNIDHQQRIDAMRVPVKKVDMTALGAMFRPK